MTSKSAAEVARDIRVSAARWTIRANGGYLAQACGSAESLLRCIATF